MNAFTIVNRRPTFSTAIAAGSVRPQQMLPPGSPLFSHTSPVMPVGPEPARRNPIPVSGRVSRVKSVNPVGPEPVLQFGLPTYPTFHATGHLEAILPHFVE